MSRRYPLLPVCAVGGVIFQGRRVLLVRRGKPPSQGKWSLPGGRVHLGETLEAAIIRETKEETHLVVKPLQVGKVVEHIFKDTDNNIQYHYVIVDYVCRIIEGVPQPASDASQLDFVEIAKLGQMDMTTGTADVIQEIFDQTWPGGTEPLW